MSHVPKIFPQVNDLEFEGDVSEFYDVDDEVGLIDTAPVEPLPLGFTWAFDFNSGDITFVGGNPPIVRGVNAVNQWIQHTLSTEQFETPIFGGDIGTALTGLIGDPLDAYTSARVRQEIVDALTMHDRISEVLYINAFELGTNLYSFVSYSLDEIDNGTALLQLR